MSAALQVFHVRFDAVFFKLPPALQDRLAAKIDAVGLRLATFPHHRLTGSARHRLRVGDYRIIYAFELGEHTLHLLAVGHRREIYRE